MDRVEVGGIYWYVEWGGSGAPVVSFRIDLRRQADNACFEAGNYYRTRAEAVEAACCKR